MKTLSRKSTAAALDQSIDVLLLDNDSSRISILKKAFAEFNFSLLSVLSDEQGLIDALQRLNPQVLIVGIDEPSESLLQTISRMNAIMPLPIVMFAEKDTPHIVDQIVKAGVNAFVVDDIQPSRLRSIITVAMARFEAQYALKTELEETKEKLAERKVLEKAKGILMEQKGFSEDDAYKALRKMSMDKGQSIGKVAESIIDVFTLLD